MAADRAEHVAAGDRAGVGVGRLGRHRPLLRVDHRLPGLRAGPRRGRPGRAGGVGDGGRRGRPLRARRRAGRGGGGAAGAGGTARAPARTGWNGSDPTSRRGCARGSSRRRRRTRRAGWSSTARVKQRRSRRISSRPCAPDWDPSRSGAGERRASGARTLRGGRRSGRGGRRAACRRGATRCTRISSAGAEGQRREWRRPTASRPRCSCPEGGCGVCATCRGALAGNRSRPAHRQAERARRSARRRCARSSRWPSAARSPPPARSSWSGDAPRPRTRPGPAQDARGATRPDGVHPPGRRAHAGPHDHREPLRRGGVPSRARDVVARLARGVRGRRRTWRPWSPRAAAATWSGPG